MAKRWQAKWIQDPLFDEVVPLSMLHKEHVPFRHPGHPEPLKNHHMLVRRTFRLTDLPMQAGLEISADDYYKLYINGEYVAQGPAQSYPFHYYYNRLDVTPYLRQGDNVVAVHLFYQGLVNRSLNSGDLRQGMIAELAADGRTLLGTDEQWRYRRTDEYGGPDAKTTGYDTQFFEHIDSRLHPSGWRLPEFDDADWKAVSVNPSPDYSFYEQPTPLLSVRRVKPVQVVRKGDDHYLIDFGQETIGQFTMRARGRTGETVEIRCGEELTDDGQAARYDMRCNCVYREEWTLSGGEDELEHYDYKAFRYVEVIGPGQAFDPSSFAAIARHYPLGPNEAVFASPDPKLQGIWDICRNGVIQCSQESYVDCPSREKGQYLGDNSVTGHSHLYVSGDARLFRKSIADFAHSAAICPGMMAVAPGNLMQEIADFSLQWPMQLLTYYRYTGDIDFVREMQPFAEAVLAHFRQYRREDGLLDGVKDKWNLVDWPEPLRDGYDFPLKKPIGDGCHNVINAFYYGCVQTVQELRNLLGITYRDELPQLRESFRRAFYRPAAGRFADAEATDHASLHANALSLLFGLAPEEATRPIVQLIREKRLSCGVYMSYFVLKALAAAEEFELLYELLLCDDERSWSNMLREGATTCFEAWGKAQKWNTSLCHAWASAPIPLWIEDVVGLKPMKPGWSEVSFTPHLPADSPDFQLSFAVPAGVIRVECAGGEVRLQLPETIVQQNR